MSATNIPWIGTIEGFFGTPWSWEERNSHLEFLAQNEFNFYLYAPKSDKNLRRHWSLDWDDTAKKPLRDLRNTSSYLNIEFGMGLSPLELYLEAPSKQREQLQQRLISLNEWHLDVLCILFDDMRGDIPNLAQLQVDLTHLAANTSNAKKIIFCPTYYSTDPVLEKVFGTKPANYWETLAHKLDPQIDIFWTGEKVCSPNYSIAHLESVTQLLGRRPFLWDNYPVNDGAIKSQHLHLHAFPVEHGLMGSHVAGHAINPMNQAQLSQIAMSSLPKAYKEKMLYRPEQALDSALGKLCSKALGETIKGDIALFEQAGLKTLNAAQKLALAQKYQQFRDEKMAQEIIDWLDGKYTFDPNCLTE